MASAEEQIAAIIDANKSKPSVARPGDMEFGIMSVSDVTRDPVSGETPSEGQRLTDSLERPSTPNRPDSTSMR